MTLILIAAVVADTSHTAAPHIERDPPLGVYISLAALALTIAGMLVQGGIMIGDIRAVRREHHKRLEDLERAAVAAAAERITRQELNALLAGIDGQLRDLRSRLSDLITLFTDGKR